MKMTISKALSEGYKYCGRDDCTDYQILMEIADIPTTVLTDSRIVLAAKEPIHHSIAVESLIEFCVEDHYNNGTFQIDDTNEMELLINNNRKLFEEFVEKINAIYKERDFYILTDIRLIPDARFVEIDPKLLGEEEDVEASIFATKWWLDTARPLPEKEQTEHQKFVAVQTEAQKDPNNFIKHDRLFNIFNDQAEYYHVCNVCYSIYRHLQWSGGTRMNNWRERSEKDLEKHVSQKGWCEFCDPIFGNGGWIL